MKSCLLLESRHHWAAARRALGEEADRAEKVALYPDACYALDRDGVSYEIPEDGPEGLRRAEFEYLQRLEVWCAYTDRFLQARIPALKACGLRPVAYHVRNWFVLFSALFLQARVLERLFERLAPAQVYFFPAVPEAFTSSLCFRDESVWGHLVPLVCRARQVPAIPLPAAPAAEGAGSGPSVQDRLLRLGRAFQRRAYRWFSPGARHGLGGRFRRMMPGMARGGQRPSLLVLWDGYDAQPVVDLCLSDGRFDVISWTDSRSEPVCLNGAKRVREAPDSGAGEMDGVDLEALWSALSQDRVFRGFFEWDGVDWFSIVEARLRYFFTVCLPEALWIHRRAERVLEEFNPSVVLKGNESDYRDMTVTDAALKRGIPVALCQHGGSMGYITSYPYLPLESWGDGSDVPFFFLTYGKGVKAYFDWKKENRPFYVGQNVVVGSGMLDRLAGSPGDGRKVRKKLGVRPDRPTVVYASGGFYGNTRCSVSFYSDSFYYTLLRQVVHLFARFRDIEFVLKLYPGDNVYNPIPDLVRDLHADHIRAVRSVPFREVLPAADLLVVDFPSTTLLQSLMTNRPMVVYADARFLALDAHAAGLLRKRVCLAQTADAFLELIRQALTERRFDELEDPDREFLMRYGTHLHDGNSARRAQEFLAHLALEKPSAPRIRP